jgi:hypothetical protein
MKLNRKTSGSTVTYEGGKANKVNAKEELRRAVFSCLLWENQFYEEGVSIADRIEKLVPLIKIKDLEEIAIYARENMKLRHVPLLIAVSMAKHSLLNASLLERIIQRADEITEFMAIYWKNGKCPIANQVKKGLARAFTKFTEYDLAKYNRDADIKLRDVLFLVHAKPKDFKQSLVWKRLIKDELKTPDTWEVSLSKYGNKKEVWERLLKEEKLGALALLRNLRNMQEAGVSNRLISSSLSSLDVSKVLPFRFISAAKILPNLEEQLEKSLFKCVEKREKLRERTILLVDVSGSMEHNLSDKSEITRMDVACGLGILVRELCKDIKIFTFSNSFKEIPNRRGFALRDAIISSQEHSSTLLGSAVTKINNLKYDRLIIITDEQSQDDIPNPQGKGYIINVASYDKGIGYGRYTHINGWSESVLDYIIEIEK